MELGEIEYHLLSISEIKQCTVVLNDEKALVAYIVFSNTASIDIDYIRDYLKTKLPFYMVPNIIVEIESIPLTFNGKIDKNRLPKTQNHAKQELIPLHTQTQQMLSNIWSDLLQVNNFGTASDFFHLGGNSLMAIRLVAIIHERFNVFLSMKMIFENPTLQDMSNMIDMLTWSNAPINSSQEDIMVGFI